jgi:hypothetical protein
MQPKVNIFNYLQTENLRLNIKSRFCASLIANLTLKIGKKDLFHGKMKGIWLPKNNGNLLSAAVVILLSNKSTSHFF